MPEHATEEIRVEAPLDRCFEVVSDFAEYPQWAPDIKQVSVDERDDLGRGTVVTFRAAAMGRSTTLRIRYSYDQAPGALTWELIEGDVIRQYEGRYGLTEAADDPGCTDLTYSLTLDLILPLPGFVKRRGEARLIKAALPDLKAYIERVSRPG